MSFTNIEATSHTFKGVTGIENILNNQLSGILDKYIVDVQIVTRDKARKLGKEIDIQVSYDDTSMGATTLLNPFELITFIGTTLQEVSDAAEVFRLANPGFFHAVPFIKYLNQFASANKPFVVYQFYCQDPNGIDNWVMANSASSVTTPGGANQQVQFNDGGAFGGDAGLQFDKATGKLTVAGLIDPTGIEFTPVATNPGGITDNTLWQDQASKKLFFGDDPVTGGGGATFTRTWTYDNNTAAADPGSGLFRLDNTTIALATHLYISETDENGSSVAALLDLMEVGDKFYFENSNDSNESAIAQVTAIVDNGAWRDYTITVELIGSAVTWTTTDTFGISLLVGSSEAAAGSNTEVQFNSNGTFGANSNFRYVVGTGLRIDDTTSATSSTTGALVVAGGVGITKNLYVGSLFNVEAGDSVHVSSGQDNTSSAGVHIDGPSRNGAGTTGGLVFVQSSISDRRLYFTGSDSRWYWNVGGYSTNSGEFGIRNGAVGVGGQFRIGVDHFMVNADDIALRAQASAIGNWLRDADTDGRDTYFRTQSGGNHIVNNPRGGDFIIQPGGAGAGGTGRDGEFRVEGNTKLNGKLTVAGLIDPTGLELTPVLANPGNYPENTLWLNGDNNAISYSAAGGVGATFTGTITGVTSGATATVVSDDGAGNLVVDILTGAFQVGETIQDAQVHFATVDAGGVAVPTFGSTALGSQLTKFRTIYFGKHGNDADDGFTLETAKLTIGAAITAASALTPTAAAPVMLWCEDAGVYTEDLVVPSNVSIYAPDATLIPNSATGHSLADNCAVTFFKATRITTGFLMSSGGHCSINLERAGTEAGAANGQWMFLVDARGGLTGGIMDVNLGRYDGEACIAAVYTHGNEDAILNLFADYVVSRSGGTSTWWDFFAENNGVSSTYRGELNLDIGEYNRENSGAGGFRAFASSNPSAQVNLNVRCGHAATPNDILLESTRSGAGTGARVHFSATQAEAATFANAVGTDNRIYAFVNEKPSTFVLAGVTALIECLFSDQFEGDTFNVRGTTAATSTTTGALVVSGGVGILGNGWFGGYIDVAGDIRQGAATYHYFGAPTTNGSWRIGRSGNNLVFERRESAAWVTKQTITP